MKRNIKFFIMTIVALFTVSAAQADVESWYTYWSLGLSGGMSYPSKLSKDLDTIESAGEVDRTRLNLDMLGFYWPLEDGETMMGFVINGVSDVLSGNSITLRINQYLYAFSAMKFFGKEIGDGFFIRGDAGLARAMVSLDGTPLDFEESSKWGIGALAGIGYGLPVSSESRWIFSLNYSYKNIDFPNDIDNYASGSYGALQFSVGGLW